MSTHPGTADLRITTLVVDPHDASRLGCALILQRQSWVERCLMARDRREAVALVERHRPDVALVDVSPLGPFVSVLTDALRAAHPSMAIVLTARCAGAMTRPPADAGPLHVVPHGAPAAQLARTVRAAALQERIVLPELPGPRVALSPREREVLELIATGATNREIAARLHVGPDTVKKHASGLYRKLGVRNRTEAARRAAALLAEGAVA